MIVFRWIYFSSGQKIMSLSGFATLPQVTTVLNLQGHSVGKICWPAGINGSPDWLGEPGNVV